MKGESLTRYSDMQKKMTLALMTIATFVMQLKDVSLRFHLFLSIFISFGYLLTNGLKNLHDCRNITFHEVSSTHTNTQITWLTHNNTQHNLTLKLNIYSIAHCLVLITV
jgi:hypothetical protein